MGTRAVCGEEKDEVRPESVQSVRGFLLKPKLTKFVLEVLNLKGFDLESKP